jgi:hypothetical protein
MAEVAGPDAKETIAYRASEERGRARETTMHAAYEELEKLYASARPREEKLAEKARIFRRLEADLGATRHLTNASLVQFKTYHSGEKELQDLYAACGNDATRFIRLMTRFGTRRFADQAEPSALLAPLVAEGCPP